MSGPFAGTGRALRAELYRLVRSRSAWWSLAFLVLVSAGRVVAAENGVAREAL